MPYTVDLTKRMPRGAIPSPRHALAAATPYIADPATVPPASFLVWPVQMSSWNNYIYGDCVTAEEAFAKAAAAPQTFVPAGTVVSWARENGFLNGAVLTEVMQKMQTDGFPFSSGRCNDGPYNSVDWTNSTTLQSAIFNNGPVKLGVGAGDFQAEVGGVVGAVTPGTSGWTMYNYPVSQPEDHCVSICGYGTLAQLVALFKQHGVTVNPPSGMPTGLCYAIFTWNSIGIIDEQSMLNMTYEAWIRNPVTAIGSVAMPYLIWQNNGNGAWNWAGELPDGSPSVAFSQAATGNGDSGNLQVIGLGGSDALPYLIWQNNADGAWNWYGKLPNAPSPVTFSQIVTGVGNAKNLQVVGLGANDCLPYLIWQNNGSGAWNWFGELPNAPNAVPFSQIATGVGNGSNLQVIGIGAYDGLLYLIWQNGTDGAWNWYGKLPNAPSSPVPFSQIATGVGNDGNLQVIGIGADDGLLYLIWQNGASGAWNWVGKLPNASSPITFSQVATGIGNDGNLQVIGLGSDGLLYLIWQSKTNGAWNWGGALPNAPSSVTFSQIATGVGNGGNLQVVGLGANDGLPYLIWQNSADGAWNWAGKLPNGSFALSQIAMGTGNTGNLQLIGFCL